MNRTNDILENLKKLRDMLEARQYDESDESWKDDAYSITITWNTKGKISITSKNTEDTSTLEVIGVLEMAKSEIIQRS